MTSRQSFLELIGESVRGSANTELIWFYAEILARASDADRTGLHEALLGDIAALYRDWRALLAHRDRHRCIEEAASCCLQRLVASGIPAADGDTKILVGWLMRLMHALERNHQGHSIESADPGAGDAYLRDLLLEVGKRVSTQRRVSRDPERTLQARGFEERNRFYVNKLRTGDAFSTNYVAARLGISDFEARALKRSRRFDDNQIAALLRLRLSEFHSLLTPDPSVAALNALALATDFVDIQLRDDDEDDQIGVASDFAPNLDSEEHLGADSAIWDRVAAKILKFRPRTK